MIVNNLEQGVHIPRFSSRSFRWRGIAAVFLTVSVLCTVAIADPLDTIEDRVDDLVLKHYLDGILYTDAHDLGQDAIPYLIELLNDPGKKEFWVNISVTIGFIEDSSALDALILFSESPEGEVDGHTFRALLSIPFAIGCIASNGDTQAFEYLMNGLHDPDALQVRWSFRNNDIRRLLMEKAAVGLAASGRTDARAELLTLEQEISGQEPGLDREFLIETIQTCIPFMDRMARDGREFAFNPGLKE